MRVSPEQRRSRASTNARIVGAMAVVALLLVGGGLAYVAGVGPAPGGSDGDELTSFPTETTPSETAATSTREPFDVSVESVRDCGRTCRDVTVSVSNRRAEPASAVTIYTRVFAGNSTDESDAVWSGAEEMGTLSAGATRTTTKRVELSYAEAYEVEAADGWITVRTAVETDDRTITFTERRTVD